ncbi:MAG TPA: hypothetical protein VMT27_09605 [Actinomycetes bacterium]|nr:hypothetical protein [Actinomycetes bacterium]
MTVLVTIDIPASRHMLEATAKEMGTSDNPPAGLIVHVATETATGCRVSDVWATEEHFIQFRRNRLLPAISRVREAHGLSDDVESMAPQHTVTDAFDLVRGR